MKLRGVGCCILLKSFLNNSNQSKTLHFVLQLNLRCAKLVVPLHYRSNSCLTNIGSISSSRSSHRQKRTDRWMRNGTTGLHWVYGNGTTDRQDSVNATTNLSGNYVQQHYGWKCFLNQGKSNHLPYLHFISCCFDINILYIIFNKTYHIKPDENKN